MDLHPRPARQPLLAALTVSALVLGGLAVSSPARAASAPVPADAAAPPAQASAPRAVPEVTPGEAGIVGTAKVDQTLTATDSGWDPVSVTMSYRWFRDGSPIPGATGQQYALTASDMHSWIMVELTGSAPGYIAGIAHSQTVWVQPGTITCAVPTISGEARTGSTVTAAPGAWGPGYVDFEYQWLRDGSPIPGATSASYTITGDIAGGSPSHRLSVSVAGTKPGYSFRVCDSASQLIGLGLFEQDGNAASLAGAPQVGLELTAYAPELDPVPESVEYQWLRNGQWIPGAKQQSYRLTPADAGARISVMIRAQSLGYEVLFTTSSEVEVPELRSFDTAPAPRVTGTPLEGRSLTAVLGSWSPVPETLRYQWLRDGVALPGETDRRYVLTQADRGHRITVAVSAGRPGYLDTQRLSTAVAVPRVLTAPTPRIVGTPKAGRKLVARAGSWKPAGVELKYQWKRNGTAIRGATKTSYRLTKQDRGTRITVTVTGTKRGYVTAAKASKAIRIR